jgi:tRNA(Phe) wybutosine-synthesizing methylase Tyw3
MMMMQNDDNFERRKSATVSSLVMTSDDDDDDKSRAGRVDERVRDFVERVNACENIFTTSSCSGRVSGLRGEDGGRLQREEERRRVGVRFARVSRQRRRRGGKKFDGGEDEGKFKKVIINVDAAV